MTNSPSETPETSPPIASRPVAPLWLLGIVLILALGSGFGTARAIRTAGMTSVTGRLEAERVMLRSATLGEVVSCDIEVGQEVEPGDVVAVIRRRVSESRDELERTLASLTHEEAALMARYEFESGGHLRGIDAEIHDLEMRIASLLGDQYAAEVERVAWRDALDATGIHQAGHKSSSVDHNRVVKVFGDWQTQPAKMSSSDRFHAIISHERAAATADSCDAQVSLCQSRLTSLKEERERIADQFRKTLGLDVVAAEKARVAAIVDSLDKTTELVSPSYGRAVDVACAGDRCSVNTAVVVLADEARRRVTTAVPTATAAELEVGNEVALIFPTGDRREGTVSFVSPSSHDGNGVSVTIEPRGKRWPDLSLGCSVDVEFR